MQHSSDRVIGVSGKKVTTQSASAAHSPAAGEAAGSGATAGSLGSAFWPQEKEAASAITMRHRIGTEHAACLHAGASRSLTGRQRSATSPSCRYEEASTMLAAVEP